MLAELNFFFVWVNGVLSILSGILIYNLQLVSGFLIYLGVVLSVCLLVGCYFGPRYGNENVLVYVTVCSFMGSLTVMASKGLGLSIRETITGE